MLDSIKSFIEFIKNCIFIIKFNFLKLNEKVVKHGGKIETGYGGSLNTLYAGAVVFAFSKYYLSKDLTTPILNVIKNKTTK